MKLSTSSKDFIVFGYDDIESIIAIREAGFRYIDFSFTYDYENRCGLMGKDWKAFAEKLLKLSVEKDFKFVQAHSPVGGKMVFSKGNESFLADTKHSIEAAAYLGIPSIVIHSGYEQNLSRSDTLKKNKAFYEDLLKVAEKYNVLILTENFNKMCRNDYYWFDNANDLKELVDSVNHPLLKVCWDTGHANLQELSQEKELKLLGDRVAGVHIQDNDGIKDEHLVPIIFGTTDYDSVMRGLLEIGFNGYFNFEADGVVLSKKFKPSETPDERWQELRIELRKKLESAMYDIGKYILTKYNCFEE